MTHIDLPALPDFLWTAAEARAIKRYARDAILAERAVMAAEVAALYTAPQPVQPGWALVPIEPTPRMIAAGWKHHPSAWADVSVPLLWADMIAAAPQIAAQPIKPVTRNIGATEFDAAHPVQPAIKEN